MGDPLVYFRQLCDLRSLPIPQDVDGSSLERLADLALLNESYVVPVFAAFKHLALPIASEWIVGTKSDANRSTVFSRLALLSPILAPLRPLTEHFLTSISENGFVTSLFSSGSLEDALGGILRLLLYDYLRFSHYFSAESLREVASRSDEKIVRTLALAALGVLMQVSEAEFDGWLLSYVGEDSTAFQYNHILSSAQSQAKDKALMRGPPLETDFVYESTLVTSIAGVFVPKFGFAASRPPPEFVKTETTSTNIRRLALALLADKPLLLEGERGSGKTFYVEYLHSLIRPSSDLVRLHLGEQTDAKALVGTYTTGKVPGTFEWSPGALTAAVQAGRWVLIEDINRAPNDIIAVLLPLLDRRELVVPSRNQVIRAAPGFQLIATTTEDNIDVIGSRTWVKSTINTMRDPDLTSIIRSRRPFFTSATITMLVDVFRRVQEFHDKHGVSRHATTRDLFKLASRITPEYDAEMMFREAVACFASFMSDPMPLAHVIGDAMGMAASSVEPLLDRYKPGLVVQDTKIYVGRAMVHRNIMNSSRMRSLDANLRDKKFALTAPTLRLLENLAVAISHLEPVLLVGETGTGKTSVVQYLAELVRRKLVVINVSQQVEAGDLIGGFKPVDVRQLAGTLLEEFRELFDNTFSKAKNHKFVEALDGVVARQQWKNMVKLMREAVKLASPSQKQGESKRVRTEWSHFSMQIEAFEQRYSEIQKAAQFQFIEGLLVRAIRHGHWVLLDEFNLAPADTIEGIGELIGGRALTLLEQGGMKVKAHPDFRLFANMNPATDVGKRDLPQAVRTQFTELWAPSPDSDPEALRLIIRSYLPQGSPGSLSNDLAELYVETKTLADSHQLVDGTGQRPHFSVRTLTRALVSANAISSIYGLHRALYEAFSMCFLTLLDEASAEKLSGSIERHLLSKLPNKKSVLSQTPAKPGTGEFVQFNHWWLPVGEAPLTDDSSYIITPSVERNLLNLVRATSTKMFPILIQGPTSSGKTSMISYLARKTGNSVVRINNHEHTDLAEYLGGYESDADGRLVFREGALVTALRKGHWLILDELNLAPTDVLEALNRLLDDNRELLVPETQETIRPHPNFVLFATQNPPGIYAGRKILSRAFRNRFLELHFGDIPEPELESILRDRSGIPPSYASKIVEVYRELARQRVGSRVFEHTATLRDLFRWASRPAVGYEQLALNGFALLGERSRTHGEKEGIRVTIERVMRVKVDTDFTSLAPESVMDHAPQDIVWTNAMRRVLTLVHMAMEQGEPVLLVGETGCGKTTIVQALAASRNQRLVTLNAHQNTETGDLVGSQRPARHDASKMFEWVDGPLVSSMKRGDMFLLDEISLADDSVLERLNSVLESEKTLFVPEIGEVPAHEGFEFFATMNPGGDYGKKELSPALRNRFTEIWVPAIESDDDLRMIVGSRIADEAVEPIVKFSKWFGKEFGLVSLRDILSWTQFVNTVGLSAKTLVHGAFMVFIDALGSNTYAHLAVRPDALKNAKQRCYNKITELVGAKIDVSDTTVDIQPMSLTIGGFTLPRVDGPVSEFSLAAPTSALNAMRVVRAMQVRKPVLLEGSPGAGKTSLVAALSTLSGKPLTRINLSDQTDLADLFGQDVPLDSPGQFGWRSAPFLRAMQRGEWVLLDEMNLAPQPVLEGLNACLDHRGEAYIPELDRTFEKHPDFVVFAAQNPQAQGGGRKGLPKSFINRFSSVYVEQLGLRDLHAITEATYPEIDRGIRTRLAEYVEELANWSASCVISGGPFEFNLRDTMRWLDLVSATREDPAYFLYLVVVGRLRTESDRKYALNMFLKYFKGIPDPPLNPVDLGPKGLSFGLATTGRTKGRTIVYHHESVSSSQIPFLETAIRCIERAWPLLLVGATGSGKTSMIRLLAQLCGTKLHEFAMTPDIDSTDLLGEFDQLEEQSELERLWAYIEEDVTTSDYGARVDLAKLEDSVRQRNLGLLMSLLPPQSGVHSAIAKFQSRDFSKPVFQWIDGMLLRAVEEGHWIVLDNANLCSPAVLDRLNSLLERGGSLSVNECSQSDGTPREVRPHPSFRLFMTVDPKYGELSRAMRNRSIEVWVGDGNISSFDELVFSGLTASAALPMQFPRAFNVAKFSELREKSWLRALLLEPQSVRFISRVDAQLGSFASSMQVRFRHRGGFEGGIAWLQQLWIVFGVKQRLAESLLVNTPKTLLEVSALRRRKDSVECSYDIFSVVEACCAALEQNLMPELASVLVDFVIVQDPSRVLVFRDWLIKFARDKHMSELQMLVERGLGREYDFSEGGEGMIRLWKQYGRPMGFATGDDVTTYTDMVRFSTDFDRLVEQLGPEYSSQVTEIRLQLAGLSSSSQLLQEAFHTFRTSLPEGAMTAHNQRQLTEQFRHIWGGLSLFYTADDSKVLKGVLGKLAFFAHIPTVLLGEVLEDSSQNGIVLPHLSIPQKLEQTLMDAMQLNSQGQARAEIRILSEMIMHNSTEISASMKPEDLVRTIVYRLSHSLASAIPYASEILEKIRLQAEADSGGAAISLAREILWSYVSPLPVDPAIAQHVWFEQWLRLRAEYAADDISWDELQVVFGTNSKDVEGWLSSRRLQQQPVPSVWRPSTSDIHVVHRDMLAMVQLAKGLEKALHSKASGEVFAKNIEHLYSRLSRATAYRDLVAVVRTAIVLLKLGFELKQDTTSAITEETETNLWLLDPTIVGDRVPDTNSEPLLSLKSMSCMRRLPLEELQELLNGQYRRWTLERLQLEEQRREEVAGFKYDDDDGLAAEREFRQLFPDYDELPDLPTQEDRFLPEFVGAYTSLFNGQKDHALPLIVKAAGSLVRAKGKTSQLHLPALFLALRRGNDHCEDNVPTNINFYTDSSTAESAVSVDFADRVSLRVRSFLTHWPEHDTLRTLLTVATEIKNLPPVAPIALHLSKLEQLHHYLYEWDRFASKDVKVEDLLSGASNLVVRWRRLELATWPSLFESEKRRIVDGDAPFWFHLYEILVATPSEDTKEIARILVVYMAESSIGLFESRLNLLQSFSRHLVSLKNMEIAQCVKNVHAFMLQFLPQIQGRLISGEKALRKEVEEVVKLASWRDVNIHALKQSAQRSHRQLFKVIRKYRALLSTKAPTDNLDPAKPIMFQSRSSVSDSDTTMNWNASSVDILKATQEWTKRPKYLQQLKKTKETMENYILKVEGAFSSNADLEDLAESVGARARELREETPKIWSKENKKLISTLRMQKQQFLTSTLKELRSSGLRSAVRKDTMISQREMTGVLALVPSFSENDRFSETDATFFALVELVPRLRAAVSDRATEGANDVPQPDLARGMAYAENAFALVLRMRRIVGKHLSSAEPTAIGPMLSELSNAPAEVVNQLESARVQSLRIADMIQNVLEVIISIYDESGTAIPSVWTKVSAIAERVYRFSELQFQTSDNTNWSNELLTLLQEAKEHVAMSNTPGEGLTTGLISELAMQVRTAIRLFEPVEPTLISDVDSQVLKASNTVLVVLQQLLKLGGLHEKPVPEDTSESDEAESEWLIRSVEHAEKLLLSLHYGKVWHDLSRASELILRLSSQRPDIAAGYAGSLIVFVHGFLSAVRTVEGLYSNLLQRTTAGTLHLSKILLSLATEGFCSPEPHQEDDEETQEKGDALGLGDGQGAQSSSKDLDEQDDDVAEAMQTANPDQEDRDEGNEEDDKTNEVEGEMAGQLEDAPPDDEDSAQDDSDDQDEPDDEVGDLDDLDPSAVDEKMWDDQKDNPDQKEKETSDTVQGSADKEDLEGKEGEDNHEKPELDQDAGTDSNEASEDDGSSDDDQNQDESVKQGDRNELDSEVEQKDALDLPEDMDLDSPDDEDDREAESSADESDIEEDEAEGEANDGDVPASPNNPDESPQETADEDSVDVGDNQNVDDMQEDQNEGGDDQNEVDNQQEDDMNAEHPEDKMDVDDIDMPEGDGEGENVEGIAGPSNQDDSHPQEDQSASTESRTDVKGEGANESASTEESQIGLGGSAGANAENKGEDDSVPDTQPSDPLRESLKQLGDAMKEFHRRQRDIREHENRDNQPEPDNDNTKPLSASDDLEHVGAEDAYDTQAFGRSTEQNNQDIDQSMAIDDEEKPDREEEVAGNEDAEAEHGAAAGTEDAEEVFASEEDLSDDAEHDPMVSANPGRDLEDKGSDEPAELRPSEPASDYMEPREDSDLWQRYEAKTQDLALVLGEQLRLILEPTVASKLRGDYRTGKRLNMKRIIPYIASEFRKDKIWLRRTKPAKRQYQVMLALDDSKSMGEPAAIDLAFQSISLVGKALSAIEAGEIGIAKFGNKTEFVHPLNQPLNSQAGNAVLRQFHFQQDRTNVHELLARSIEVFSTQSTGDEWKLEIIISDGITENHEELRRLVRKAYEEHIMVVFVVLDALNKDTSILSMNEVRYTTETDGTQRLRVVKYMEDFPFDYYVIVRDIADLPMVLASVLRQYFQANQDN